MAKIAILTEYGATSSVRKAIRLDDVAELEATLRSRGFCEDEHGRGWIDEDETQSVTILEESGLEVFLSEIG